MALQGQGVAYDFHLACERARVAQRMSKLDLCKQAGISRATYDRFADGDRPPLARVVTAVADVLGIDRERAAELAGLVPAQPAMADVEVRNAIARSSAYTADQKRVLLGMIDVLDAANGVAPGRSGDTVHHAINRAV